MCCVRMTKKKKKKITRTTTTHNNQPTTTIIIINIEMKIESRGRLESRSFLFLMEFVEYNNTKNDEN